MTSEKCRTNNVWRSIPFALCTALLSVHVFAAVSLPPQQADLSETSVSGVSSGGYMAVQFHVAYSALVNGVGVIAGGPYNCADNSAWRATHNCMHPDRANPVPDVGDLVARTDRLAVSGEIDPPSHLVHANVWLFSGTQDAIVSQPVMDALAKYYEHYVTSGAIFYKHDLDAGHGMIVDDSSAEACPSNADPYMNDCSYDAAGLLLQQIYGRLNPPSFRLNGTFIEYDQTEFFDGDAYVHSMRDSGFVYVPESCRSSRCRVHVAFHGCLQNYDTIGDRFYKKAGYNQWADSNHLIVVYPQTIARLGWNWKAFWNFSYVLNPNACWDWWGYDGPDYYKKSGAQMKAVRKMLERLALPRN
ncbi:MAG TPA: hypothetical protein VJR03_08580 [Nitrospira sp.]|nr:hypothetical protein [Nitrospira sp.]